MLSKDIENINVELERLTGVRWLSPRYQAFEYLKSIDQIVNYDMSNVELFSLLQKQIKQTT